MMHLEGRARELAASPAETSVLSGDGEISPADKGDSESDSDIYPRKPDGSCGWSQIYPRSTRISPSTPVKLVRGDVFFGHAQGA